MGLHISSLPGAPTDTLATYWRMKVERTRISVLKRLGRKFSVRKEEP